MGFLHAIIRLTSIERAIEPAHLIYASSRAFVFRNDSFQFSREKVTVNHTKRRREQQGDFIWTKEYWRYAIRRKTMHIV